MSTGFLYGSEPTQVHVNDVKALHDTGLITWEQPSRGLIQFDVTSKGSWYYDHLKEPRYTTQQQFQRVLHAIAKYQQQHDTCAPDTFIVEELDLPIIEVRAYMDELARVGLTLEANTQEARCALLGGSGPIALNDPDFLRRRLEPAGQHISGNIFQNSNVNIGLTLTSITQTIKAAGSVDQATKAELTALVEQLQVELQKVPADMEEDAEAVAEEAKRVVELATRERPNKRLITISAQGLKQAAENLAGVASPVVTIVSQILPLIQNMPA